MATPVLGALRSRFRAARITAMCQANIAPILRQDPNVEEVYAFQRPNGWLHRQSYKNILHSLRCGRYDLGILLTNSWSSAWWFWRGNVSYRMGYATQWRSGLLNGAVPLPRDLKTQHLVLTYQQLLEPLGIPATGRRPTLYLHPGEIAAAADFLKRFGVDEDSIVVGVNPGAAYGSAKCWLPSRFKQVTQRLVEDPRVRVVYVGDQGQAALIDKLCLDMPASVINLAGKTSLRELVAILKRCTVLLTNDSGPMHIAAALGTPLVALFGSTSDVRTGPYQHGTVLHKHVTCSPCYKRVCPIDFRCMTHIQVDEVYDAVQAAIKQ